MVWFGEFPSDSGYVNIDVTLSTPQKDIFIAGRFSGKVDFDIDSSVSNIHQSPYFQSSSGTSPINDDQPYLLRLDSNGAFKSITKYNLDTMQIGNNAFTLGVINDLLYSSNNELYSSGYFRDTIVFDSNFTFGAKGIDGFVAKHKSSGKLDWVRHFEGQTKLSECFSRSISFDSLENILVSGTFSDTVNFDPDTNQSILNSQWPYRNVFILKLSNNPIRTSLTYFQPTLTNARIYPNPTQSELWIEREENAAVNLFLFNAQGQLILTKRSFNSLENINITGPPGLYFLKSIFKDQTKTHTIIKH